jgi:hypothetical protein
VGVTGANFVLTGPMGAYLVGETVVTGPTVVAFEPEYAANLCANTSPGGSVDSGTNNAGTCLDRVSWDLSLMAIPLAGNAQDPSPTMGLYVGNFAKNGALYITFISTTPVTINMQAWNAAVGVTSSQAGDTSLTTIYALVIRNLSLGQIVMTPAASNPAPFPIFSGTNPALSINAGGAHCFFDPTGQAVSSTANGLTFTPTSDGILSIAYGGG